jgi:hypothetical protein
MANWRKRFPSKYYQASDFEDGPIDLTIRSVENELIGTGDRAELKPILFFRDKGAKGVVLNLTRAEAVETIAGTFDDNQWAGVRVRLQKGKTLYQGKRVDCVDIVAPPAAPPTKRSKGKPSSEPEPDDPMPTVDDEDAF